MLTMGVSNDGSDGFWNSSSGHKLDESVSWSGFYVLLEASFLHEGLFSHLICFWWTHISRSGLSSHWYQNNLQLLLYKILWAPIVCKLIGCKTGLTSIHTGCGRTIIFMDLTLLPCFYLWSNWSLVLTNQIGFVAVLETKPAAAAEQICTGGVSRSLKRLVTKAFRRWIGTKIYSSDSHG